MNLTQDIREEQVLSLQQQQSLKLLQLSSLDLTQELSRILADNPVVDHISSPLETITDNNLEIRNDDAESTTNDDDIPSPQSPASVEFSTFSGKNSSPSSASSPDPFLASAPETLHAHLLSQLPYTNLSSNQQSLAAQLIGEINAEGYFLSSLPDLQMITGASAEQLISLLKIIQTFHPHGCGARNLSECLLAQVDSLADNPFCDTVRKLIVHHLTDIAENRYSIICTALGINLSEYAAALKALRTLNPKPGLAFPFSNVPTNDFIYPEITTHFDEKTSRLIASCPPKNLPTIHLAQRYVDMLHDPDCTPEVKEFINNKIKKIDEINDALNKRQETIQRIAQCIIDHQGQIFTVQNLLAPKDKRKFSIFKDQILPLTMEEVANECGISRSTVSRTVSTKWMTTPLGSIPLKDLFKSNQALNQDAVMPLLRQIIENEDKAHPLSDEVLTKQLAAHGHQVARRTIAKYRDILKIPPASKRKL